MTAYADVEIRILPRRDEGYPVEIILNSEQEYSGGYLDPGFLPWVPGASPSEDGEKLFDWLFAADALKVGWAEVRGQHPQRGVRLRIDEGAPELHTIPWELLRDREESQDITATEATPFSRYLAGKWQPGAPILKRPIKILLAVANPTNLNEFQLAEINPEDEWTVFQEVLADVKDVEVGRLEGRCTLLALEEALRDGYHILHLVAHGQYSARRQQTVIYLANEDNQVALVNGEELVAMLTRQLADIDIQREDKIRLVFLASCQTARNNPADAFRAVAPAMVAAGIPAVLAMQDLVPVQTAQAFSRTFYQRLLQHGRVDLASNEARSHLLTAKLPGATIPVLFMRLRDGQLLGRPGQILGAQGDTFWQTLIENIADKECTPFLGPGVTANQLPSPDELARDLAERYGYPFLDQKNQLPKVAQFIATTDDRRLRRDLLRLIATHFKGRMGLKYDQQDRRKTLCEIIESINWSERSQAILETETHHQLAELELPLYLTTNFDNLMTLAIQSHERKPRRETIPWRQTFRENMTNPNDAFDRPISKDEPVVLHLFGTEDDLQSLVITEDDHLDYLVRLSKDWEYLIPTEVQEALAYNTLLFLGYRLEDLDFRVILRGLLTNVKLDNKVLRVAVQIEADRIDQAKEQEVIRYFQKYLALSHIEIYWGSTQQFMADLYARWQEYRLG